MKGLEPLWYEISPYLFFLVGISAIAGASRAGVAFGVLLLVMALLIIKMRWSYRACSQYGTTKVARKSPRRVTVTGNTRARYRAGGEASRALRTRSGA